VSEGASEHMHQMKTTPSPRPSGERAGEKGFEPVNIGLLTPSLSSLGGGEGEKNGACVQMRPGVSDYKLLGGGVHL
jgi:hypothetical protein